MANRTKRTAKKVIAILSDLRAGSAIGTACARAGIGRTTLHEWRAADSALDQQIDEAIEYGTDILEDVARTRAVMASDTLLIFLLKARRPEKYRETIKQDHGGTVKHQHEHRHFDLSRFSPREVAELDALAAKYDDTGAR